MKRDLPEHLAAIEQFDKPSRSMLASRAFWIGGVLSVAIWATMLVVALR